MARCAIYQCKVEAVRQLTTGPGIWGEFTDWFCGPHADEYEAKGYKAVGKVKSATAGPTAAGHHQLSLDTEQ